MFRWSPFPFLRLALAFIIGILVFEVGVRPYLPIGTLFLAGYLLGYWLHNKWLTGVSGLLLVSFLGVSQAWIQNPTRHADHLSNLDMYQMQAYSGIVAGNEVEKEKYYRYDLDVNTVLLSDSSINTSGRIHIYVYKEDSLRLDLGDVIFVNSFFTEIPQPKNPAEFNYSDYIKRSRIYGQSFIHRESIKIAGHVNPNLILSWSSALREDCREIINQYVTSDQEKQIAQALIIGIKDYLDQDVKTAYASVGAMHVLAVSGLHVGIIYLILLTLLKPLRLLPYGSYLVFVSVIVGIWFYAMITGLSPSVMRAATMFSVVSLKEISVRRANIYNSLGLAALVLLLVDVNYLFAVGFQLSFIAVFGIVYFHPKLYGLFTFNNWLGDKIWSISCISIAAQLATFPLSMYYFSQFPVYFLVSNLIVIPGAMALLVIGLALIVSGFISSFLGSMFGWLLTKSIFFLNKGIFLIDQLPNSLITGLHLTSIEVWLSYGVIVFLFLALQYRSFGTLAFATMIFVSLMGSVYHRNWNASVQQQLVFYEIPDKTVIDIIDGKNSKLLIDNYQTSEMELLQYQIDPYRRYCMLQSISEDIEEWQNSDHFVAADPFKLFYWKGVKILILDNVPHGVHFNQPIEAQVLLLCQDAVRNLYEIPEDIKYKQLLISSDYSADALRRLQWQSRKEQIPFHSLSKDGYWMLDLNKTQNL
jgi:competence protein ComEC